MKVYILFHQEFLGILAGQVCLVGQLYLEDPFLQWAQGLHPVQVYQAFPVVHLDKMFDKEVLEALL